MTRSEKYALSKLGEKNPMWKGDTVGYAALHEYIKNRFPMPAFCQLCHIEKPRDLANKTGQYLRLLDDWLWLCRRCHMKNDGRMSNLRPKIHPMLGKHLSEDTKQKIRAKAIGRKFSEEFKRKVSLGKRGQGLGTKRPQEWKERIRLAALRRWQRYRDAKA